MKLNSLIRYGLTAATISLILAGCAPKPPCVTNQPIIKSPPPKTIFVCKACLSSNPDVKAIQLAGGQVVNLGNRTVILIPSESVFPFDEARFLPRAEGTLVHLANLLKRQKDADISLSVHTDPIASEKKNQKLSEQKATLLAGYLWTHGVPRANLHQALQFKGKGEKEPIASNTILKGMAMNRRIEIVIGAKKPAMPKLKRAYWKSYGK